MRLAYLNDRTFILHVVDVLHLKIDDIYRLNDAAGLHNGFLQALGNNAWDLVTPLIQSIAQVSEKTFENQWLCPIRI